MENSKDIIKKLCDICKKKLVCLNNLEVKNPVFRGCGYIVSVTNVMEYKQLMNLSSQLGFSWKSEDYEDIWRVYQEETVIYLVSDFIMKYGDIKSIKDHENEFLFTKFFSFKEFNNFMLKLNE